MQELVQEFDVELRESFQVVMGVSISDLQWDQASFRVKESGLGLCRAADVADVAYMASRNDVFDDRKEMDWQHVWDDGPLRERPEGTVTGNGFSTACLG